MRRQRGFSLIEILVVLVIMGLLISVVAPTVLNSADDARVMSAFPASFLAACLGEAMQQPKGMVEEYRAWARPWGFAYNNIHCPATIFRGTSDQLIPRSWSEHMATALPQGVFQEVPNAGHLFPITDWQRVLRPFLA